MGDSSCSASTAFKSLVDHGAEDRSLHQDRFSAAPTSQQGFRSAAPNTSTQAQDAFGAFIHLSGSTPIPARNLPIPDGLALLSPHLADQSARCFPLGPFQSVPHVPTLATFGGAHVPQHQSNTQPGASNWAQDFARFSQGNTGTVNHEPVVSNGQQQPYRSAGLAPGMMAFSYRSQFFGSLGEAALINQQGTTNAAATAEADFDREMDRWMAAHGDQVEDVDAIMEELARQMEQEQPEVSEPQDQHNVDNLTSTANVSVGQVKLQNEQSAKQTSREAPLHGRDEYESITDSRLRPDCLPDISRLDINGISKLTSEEHASQRQSEISEAARQILESVQHEQSDKWKNSQFLLLMKEFRDGNKNIIDNEILETRADGDDPSEQITAAGN